MCGNIPIIKFTFKHRSQLHILRIFLFIFYTLTAHARNAAKIYNWRLKMSGKLNDYLMRIFLQIQRKIHKYKTTLLQMCVIEMTDHMCGY